MTGASVPRTFDLENGPGNRRRMLLHLSTDRVLAAIAADATSTSPAGARARPWHRSSVGTRSPSLPDRTDDGESSRLLSRPPLRERIPAIEAAIAGDAAMFREHLVDDAVGWSPSMTYGSRREAEEVLSDRTALLTLSELRLEQVTWSEPRAFVEWSGSVDLSETLLVGEENVVCGTGRVVTLVGASIIWFRGLKVAAVHTYFDEATLIEEIIVRRT